MDPDHEGGNDLSSLGDLGHPCFHLSLCMAEEDASSAEELGLVTAIVAERVKSSAACLAEAGPHLVLYSGALAHGTAEPLLRIACSAILEQDFVEGGPNIEGREEEASALSVWRLTVVMQHFLDSERLVLRLRPRCQAYVPEMRDMARVLSQGTAHEEAPASEPPESKTGGLCASLNGGAGQEQPPSEKAVEAAWRSPSGKENDEEEPADEDSWRRGGTPLPSRTRHKRPRTSVGSGGVGALPCSSFYSRKPGALLSRLQAWLSQQCSSVVVALPSSLRRGATTSPGLSSVYRVFAKQALAFHFHDTTIARHAPHLLLPCPPGPSDPSRPPPLPLKALSCPLRLWAFQAASDGHRGFAVCGLPLFLPLYLRSMPPQARHVYEIIREGYPCRLYFDVEFEVVDNPGLDGDRLVGVLLAMAAHRLHKMFGLEVPVESFLQLDSSTPSRFSRHVIAHLPRGRLFASTVHVGRFVQHLMRDIGDSQEGRCLWVKKSSRGEEGGQQAGGAVKEVLFVDTSVYTRNRSFRLLGSRKHGPGTPTFRLHNARSFRPPPLCPRGCAPAVPLDEEGLLLASLVVPHVPCGHHYPDDTTLQKEAGAGAVADDGVLLRVGEDESQPALKLGYQGQRGATAEDSSMRLASSSSAWSSAPSSVVSSSWSFGAEGGRASPFPSLDRFVLSLVTQGGVQGTIRSWSYACSNAPEGGQQEEEGGRSLLTYQIGQNRWCANVGRMHRSNHIMMVADLRRGWLVQRCHDPECRHYRSGPIVMPPWARPSLQAVEQAEFDAALAKHIRTHPHEYP